MKLGILISNSSKTQDTQKRFIRELKKGGKKFGIRVEVFTPANRDIPARIVFDRYLSKGKKEKEIYRNFHKRHQAKKISFFNSFQFIRLASNKWRLYKLLKKEKEFQKYLCPTFLYKNLRDLKNF